MGEDSNVGVVGTQIRVAAPLTGDSEWRALREPIESGWLTQGRCVRDFEHAFAERHHVAHAIATTSGTTALHLALTALGIGAGDEVILPSFTWVATANVVANCGATPVLVDVDARTFNVDVEAVAAAVTPATRAVIVVHQFGLCADVEAIAAALPKGIVIVEDAACAAGADVRGRPAGSLGAVGCFSFHPRKVLTTGEGGMLTTGDADLARRAGSLRNHGAVDPSADTAPMADHDVVGFNYRMSELHAAVGLVQLEKLDVMIRHRRELAAAYAGLLADVPWLRLPHEPDPGRHAWQSFVCVVDEDAPLSRDELMAQLARQGIESRPGTHAVHLLTAYRDARAAGPLTSSTACARRSLALPMHNRLSTEDVERVAAAVRAGVRC